MLNGYGLLIALAVSVGTLYAAWEEKRRGLPRDLGMDMVLCAVPCALVGARAYYVLFSLPQYAADPVSVFYVWEGGLAIYGGVMGGALGLYWLAKKRGLAYITLLDVAVPALLLGQAIGRWGNYINQEAFGSVVRFSALQFFPAAVQIGGVWHYATFFYESLLNALGFVYLFSLNCRKRFVRQGTLLLLYLLIYGMVRMMIEGLRTDSLMWMGVRVSQLVSVVAYAVSGGWLIRRYKMGRAFFRCFIGAAALAGAAVLFSFLPLKIVSYTVCLVCFGRILKKVWQAE